MIFVTVGTHEQQFDRLVEAMDELAGNELADEEVFIQTGYSNVEPKHAQFSKLLPASRMAQLMEEAEVVVTHGGPSSFIEAMAAGKMPVVVPRRADLEEHVNNHQVEFVCTVAERQGGIVPCYDTEDLMECIELARKAAVLETSYTSHNAEFCEGLEKLIEAL